MRVFRGNVLIITQFIFIYFIMAQKNEKIKIFSN